MKGIIENGARGTTKIHITVDAHGSPISIILLNGAKLN